MIIASSCLLGKCCRYSGGHSKSQNVLDYLQGQKYISVCPEILGGMATPRLPAEIVGGTGKDVMLGKANVYNSQGQDVTGFFITGAHKAAKLAHKNKAVSAILKENSPSCGVHNIYDGSFSGIRIPGIGVFASLLQDMGLALMTENFHFYSSDLENTCKR